MAGFKSGLFWGAVFGGIAGLLNAPRKGSKTRRELKIFIDQTKADANDLKFKMDHLKLILQRLQEEGVISVSQLVEDVQTDLRHFKEDNQPRIKRVMNRLEQLQVNLEENVTNISKKTEK